MNREAQMLAIGKLCGWEPCEPRVFLRFAPSHAFMKSGAYYGGFNSLPRYTEDLNAIHEAETLTLRSISAVERYREVLREVLVAKFAVESDITACAAHRAEALLRFFNLWRDDAPDVDTEPFIPE